MNVIAIISLVVLAVVGASASISDIRTERIPNGMMLAAFLVAIVLDVIQYIFLQSDSLIVFSLNASVSCVIALLLFFTHTWAGGDCKLCCVLSLLYPAQSYIVINGAPLTLPIAVGLAFVLGSVLALYRFASELLHGSRAFTAESVRSAIVSFAQSYACALACVSALHLLNEWLIKPFFQIDFVAFAAICFCCIWVLSRKGLLKNWKLLICLVIFDILAAALLQMMPLPASPSRYLLIFVVVALSTIVSQQNYQTIPTSEVRKGMILTMATTITFAKSRIKGLPGLSTEDLRSRLSDEEASSVRRWGESAKGAETVQIVRKMPFAIFVFLGFIMYFALWGVCK